MPRNGPNGQTQRGWKKFLIICYYFDQVSHSDFKKDIFSAKILGKIEGNSVSTSNQLWQKEGCQLTSADVLYQMMGLFDYIKAMSFYVQYIWEPFCSL